MGGYFGIDFGTTNTAVAYITGEGSNTIVERVSDTKMPFPSLLAIPKDRDSINLIFGREVKTQRMQLSSDYHIFSSFKSKLGTDDRHILHNEKYSYIDITYLYLRKLKETVFNQIGKDLNQATFAIPVDFTPEQRRDLKIAASKAKIKITRFISESTSAYLRNIEQVVGMENVVVFDWGGGTLDISVLKIRGSKVTELSVHGKRIGGDDIDELIARRIHAKISRDTLTCDFDQINDKNRDEILVESEKAKERMTDQDIHKFQLIDYVNKGVTRCELKYSEFDEIVSPIVEQAIEALYEALEKAKLPLSHLDAIILVGGSCDLRPLRNIMSKLFEDKRIKLIYPDFKQWSVAVGAAIVERSETSYKLSTDIGVMLSDGTLYPFFEKDSKVPLKINELRFGLVEDANDAHFIIADGNRNVLKTIVVPTKGFTSEGLVLNATIDEDMIGRISIYSTHMPSSKKEIGINKIGFYYDLGNLAKPEEKFT